MQLYACKILIHCKFGFKTWYLWPAAILQPSTWSIVCTQPRHRIQPFRFPHSVLIALIRFLSMNSEMRWVIGWIVLKEILVLKLIQLIYKSVLKLFDCRQTTLENLSLPCQPHSWMLHLSTSHLAWWTPLDVCTFVGMCPGQVSLINIYPCKKKCSIHAACIYIYIYRFWKMVRQIKVSYPTLSCELCSHILTTRSRPPVATSFHSSTISGGTKNVPSQRGWKIRRSAFIVLLSPGRLPALKRTGMQEHHCNSLMQTWTYHNIIEVLTYQPNNWWLRNCMGSHLFQWGIRDFCHRLKMWQ